MPIKQGWFEENLPSEDPDYVRMVEATQRLDGEFKRSDDPAASFARRISMDVLTRHALRRAEQTTAVSPQEAPSERDLMKVLLSVCFEGFAAGVLFVRSRASRRDALLDQMTLSEVSSTLAREAMSQETISGFYEGLVSMEALRFVSMARAVLYEGRIREGAMSHQQVKESQGAMWMDLFLLGAVFEELGGHRQEPAG